MFRDEVEKACNSFMTEARRSPQLLSDMAQMEYYMAESYSGRVFIELLQNADDAGSKKVVATQIGDDLYFANDGKPFDKDDLIAISRSGSSNKKRGETIGYRGVGFKSASSISKEIIIHSSSAYFTFSKSLCAEFLGMKQSQVPTIRVPILLNDVPSSVAENVDHLLQEGNTTVFVFKNAALSSFLDEAGALNPGVFLFLNNIESCSISLDNAPYISYRIDRSRKDGDEHIIVSDEETSSEWMLRRGCGASAALQIIDNEIVPCSREDAVYHCYLPTLDRAIVSCKINADFSTDPSRKHLTLDERSKAALDEVASIFHSLLRSAIDSADTGKFKNLFHIISEKSIVSKANSYLSRRLDEKLSETRWIPLNDGRTISASEYRLLPNTFDVENADLVRKLPGAIGSESMPANVYEKIDGIDKMLEEYSTKTIDLDTVVESLSTPEFAENLNRETQLQLITGVVREAKIESRLKQSKAVPLDGILVRTTTSQMVSISSISRSEMDIDQKTINELRERLGDSEIAWLEKSAGIKLAPLEEHGQKAASSTRVANEEQAMQRSMTPHISKWRDAEAKCMEIETFFGNEPSDVSIKNVGYDVLSTTPEGEKRYIEVKSVKKDYSFSLTNNEYTAAYEYGNNYYICLLCEDENKLHVRYIQNPLESAQFEKRIRQWEWACLDFSYSGYIFEM